MTANQTYLMRSLEVSLLPQCEHQKSPRLQFYPSILLNQQQWHITQAAARTPTTFPITMEDHPQAPDTVRIPTTSPASRVILLAATAPFQSAPTTMNITAS